MKQIKRISGKIGLGFLALVGAIILYFIINPFLIGYFYEFSEPKAFHGEHWFNPYENLNSENWKKANFHAHSHTVLGLNDNHSHEYEEIRERYEDLGYEIINVSDYMYINKEFEDKDDYVPIYEHGYSFKKTHQLVLGGKNVIFFDYTLYSFTSNKQYMINQLQNSSKAVALAHPSLLGGYTEEDIKYLNNYNLFEAVSRFCMSTELWDVALSYGKPAFIIANDDMHDIENPNEVGMVCTVVNTEKLGEDYIINAMKSGKAYALETRKQNLNWEAKKAYTQNYTRLESAEIIENNYIIEVNKPILKASFIGQHGKVLKEFTPVLDEQVQFVDYQIKEEDKYVRLELTTFDGHKIYLNPIYRYSEEPFLFSNSARIDWPMTLLMKLIPILLIGGGALGTRRIRRARKKRRLTPSLH